MTYVRFSLVEHRSLLVPRRRSVADVATVAGGATGFSAETTSSIVPGSDAGLRRARSVATVADVAAVQRDSGSGNASPTRIQEAATVATLATVGGEPNHEAILDAYDRLLSAGGRQWQGREVVRRFLNERFADAQRLGWTESELFGCYPDRRFAPVRYDAMGAVTLAACMGWPISAVLAGHIQFANRLSFVRGAICSPAVPVWEARLIVSAA